MKEGPMEKLELIFTHERETKNTVRYREELGDVAHSGRDIAVGTLYVQKGALGDPAPQWLRVVIEPEE
jgi:hypothetical protein